MGRVEGRGGVAAVAELARHGDGAGSRNEAGTGAAALPSWSGRAGGGGAGGTGARQLSVRALSEVAWAHSALRLHHPQLLRRAADLAAPQLQAAAAAAAAAQHEQQRRRAGGWAVETVGGATVVDVDHVVALLEAHAAWGRPAGEGPAGRQGGSAGAGAGAAGGRRAGSGWRPPYHDALFRSAAALLLLRLGELSSEQVVSVAWCCAAVLAELPSGGGEGKGRQGGRMAAGARRAEAVGAVGAETRGVQEHPVLALLRALRGLLAGTRPDSFLQPERVQLAMARAAAADWAQARGRGGGGGGGGANPLPLPPQLLASLRGAWGCAPRREMRRVVVELCGALAEAGFREVAIDARSEDGMVPVDVAALAPLGRGMGAGAARGGAQQAQRGAAGGAAAAAGGTALARCVGASTSGGGVGGGEGARYAFLVVTPDLHAVGRPDVLWGQLAAKARLLHARGWRVVLLPLLLPGAGWSEAGERAGAGGGEPRERTAAGQTAQHVREALQAALMAAERS
ncbi:hypothetical protein TSOC_012979 [Tetrabaena socialis]|uniref:Uncharacterized protein n=1 Tax=Tetrabaena socialis TaxID=47790 RepID=A0A2J7ZLJ9_9CHLO|nr:hypothetical protein TSOC_012979 [Tetrabaena socialis]|eukprot:PNH01145.1 hypothetical protein TSOC_012979 [Tetrabaena socialis]